MNKSDKTALLLLLLLLAMAFGVVFYGLQRVVEYKACQHPKNHIDSVQADILYEDIWNKALPLKEEDL